MRWAGSTPCFREGCWSVDHVVYNIENAKGVTVTTVWICKVCDLRIEFDRPHKSWEPDRRSDRESDE